MTDSTVHCIVDVFVKPESLEKVRPILSNIVENSRREDGCLAYKLFENINDKFQFTFVEMWKNEEAFENHLQSNHIQKVSIDIKDDFTKLVDIKRYKYIASDQNKMNKSNTSHFCIII